MRISLDPSLHLEENPSHSIEIPAMTIEGREQCDRIIQNLQKHAAVLWPKTRAPRTKRKISNAEIEDTNASMKTGNIPGMSSSKPVHAAKK